MNELIIVTVGVTLTGSFCAVGYFVKKKFDKVDTLCKNIFRLEQALLRIPCVSNFLKEVK